MPQWPPPKGKPNPKLEELPEGLAIDGGGIDVREAIARAMKLPVGMGLRLSFATVEACDRFDWLFYKVKQRAKPKGKWDAIHKRRVRGTLYSQRARTKELWIGKGGETR